MTPSFLISLILLRSLVDRAFLYGMKSWSRLYGRSFCCNTTEDFRTFLQLKPPCLIWLIRFLVRVSRIISLTNSNFYRTSWSRTCSWCVLFSKYSLLRLSRKFGSDSSVTLSPRRFSSIISQLSPFSRQSIPILRDNRWNSSSANYRLFSSSESLLALP